MTKDKKGITIISLVITIIVMLIILGITLISGQTLLDKARLTKIEMLLMMVKSKAEIKMEETEFMCSSFPVFKDHSYVPYGTGPSYSYESSGATQPAWYGHLVSFKLLEKNNVSPCVYNKKIIKTLGNSVGFDTYPGQNSDYLGEMELNEVLYRTEERPLIRLYCNESFKNCINRIYPRDDSEYEMVPAVLSHANTPIMYEDDPNPSFAIGIPTGYGMMDRFLFVKWGIEECVSEGIISATNNPNDGTVTYNGSLSKIDNSLVDSDSKYVIVVYDLLDFKVASVAYSVGYRESNGKVVYKLEDMLNIDVDEE